MNYGLDDSQRPFDRNSEFFRKLGIVCITLHFLYSDDNEGYIWTLDQPQKEHGIHIAKFISEYCNEGDVVYACSHYSMYPNLRELNGILRINSWENRSPESKLYSKANLFAKRTSREIMDVICRGLCLENYLQYYFGNEELLKLLTKR